MKKNGGTILFAVLGVLFIFATVCIFLLADFPRTVLYGWSLSFVLFSEILLFGGLLILNRVSVGPNGVFIRSGVAVVLTMYFFATVFSSLFSGLFVLVNKFLLVQVIIFAVAAALIALLVFFSAKVNQSDKNTQDNRKWMEYNELKVYKLMTEAVNAPYKDRLSSLYEAMHYSDKTVFTSVDESISGGVGTLEQLLQSEVKSDESILKTIDALSSQLSQRKVEASQLKRGGF